jgi:hydrogenase maturation protein HypF
VSVVRRAVRVRGVVQGVGFRPFVFGLALRRGLAGFVRNVAGEVDVEVEGEEEPVEAFLAGLRAEAPPLARIASVEVRALAPRGERGFAIRASDGGDRPGADLRLVSPDAATCADCERELFDPRDRRFRYPFVNCTSCGPRYTIIDDLPYDRAATSMAPFAMCEACRREYEDPRDRRFHAEPIACPACGPRLRFEPGGAAGEDALLAALAAIRAGAIVALRGLGGFQLACDAAREEVVRRLRERKRRFGKPFAVMVRGLDAARALGEVGDVEARALAGPERPIVLLRRRAGADLAPSLAPGLATLGVMLPSTPLHHLLLEGVGRPLVMTSGNRSEEPIATANDEALARLAAIADGFLLHDRGIRARYDDSVVRPIGRRAVPIRRARGLAPAPIALGFEAREEVLALGAHQKNAFCFAKGRHAYLSQHVGDLENAETLAALRDALAAYRRLFRLAPRAVAHDLHPDYLSSEEARRIAREEGLPLVAVQHHHAHLAACLAEHGRAGPAVGLIFDGTGLGTDGAIWGGEVLLGGLGGFERRGHLAPVRLPGGARSIERPDRMALAHLLAGAPGRDDLHAEAARGLAPEEARAVRRMVETGFQAPWTTSVGRLFDAAAALLGLGPEARYEGDLACRLEALADSAPAAEPLPASVSGAGTPGDPARMEPGPLVTALLERRLRGEDPRLLARAMHEAIAAMASEAALRVARAAALATVVLSGGCFQNRLLAEDCRARLEGAGLEVLVHELTPPNDGGIALGQAAIAAARDGGSTAPPQGVGESARGADPQRQPPGQRAR